MSRAERLYHRLVVWLLFLILFAPLAATLVYSLATQWSATLLPAGFTFKWYLQLWSDPRFLAAFGRSLAICFGALALSCVLILPAMFAIAYHFPRLDALMNVLILLPFAVPPVVSAVVAYAFFGLDQLGEEMEEPFGLESNDLPLDAMVRTIEIDLLDSLGVQPLPEPLQPRQYLLQ